MQKGTHGSSKDELLNELFKKFKRTKKAWICAMSRKNDAWYLVWHPSQKVGF